jgi:hypothetical protein
MVQLQAIEAMTKFMHLHLTDDQINNTLMPVFLDFVDKERRRDEASMQNLSQLLGHFI